MKIKKLNYKKKLIFFQKESMIRVMMTNNIIATPSK